MYKFISGCTVSDVCKAHSFEIIINIDDIVLISESKENFGEDLDNLISYNCLDIQLRDGRTFIIYGTLKEFKDKIDNTNIVHILGEI